jgi:hypothetical protein
LIYTEHCNLPYACIEVGELPAMTAYLGVGDFESAKNKSVIFHCALSHALQLFSYEYSLAFRAMMGNNFAQAIPGSVYLEELQFGLFQVKGRRFFSSVVQAEVDGIL